MRHWHDEDQFDPVDCTVANELEPYDDTLGLRATLRATAADRLPAIELTDAPHPLVQAQQDGITLGRSDELAAVVLHRV
jgi:hypothetical protein